MTVLGDLASQTGRPLPSWIRSIAPHTHLTVLGVIAKSRKNHSIISRRIYMSSRSTLNPGSDQAAHRTRSLSEHSQSFAIIQFMIVFFFSHQLHRTLVGWNADDSMSDQAAHRTRSLIQSSWRAVTRNCIKNEECTFLFHRHIGYPELYYITALTAHIINWDPQMLIFGNYWNEDSRSWQ